MTLQTDEQWHDLASLWQTSVPRVSVAEIARCHAQQRRKVLFATTAELMAAALGVVAALWLGVASQFHWVGILTAAFSLASAFVVLRARHKLAPQGSGDLLESLKGSLAYQDWLAEQLRFGRALSFVALFAIVMAASVQLMHLDSATPSGLRATAAAAAAVSLVVVWNVAMTWQVRRRTAQLTSFREGFEA